MNTLEFLENYKKIEGLIRENLEEIRQVADVPNKYQYNRSLLNG